MNHATLTWLVILPILTATPLAACEADLGAGTCGPSTASGEICACYADAIAECAIADQGAGEPEGLAALHQAYCISEIEDLTTDEDREERKRDFVDALACVRAGGCYECQQ